MLSNMADEPCKMILDSDVMCIIGREREREMKQAENF